MNTTVNIQGADFDNLENCASIALLGKRRTGKTTWAKHILGKLNKHIDRFVALCGNKDNASEWKRVIQPLYVMPKNTEYMVRLRNYQDKKVSEFSENMKPVPRKYRICVILDDCGSDRGFMHSKIMKDILSNGRHYGMTIMILCQYLNQMHAENRDQLDYIGLLYTSNHRNIKKIAEEYVNVCDLRTFKFVLNACTRRKGMCWIDNTKNPGSIEDCVYFGRMSWPCDFTVLGSSEVRDYGQAHLMNQKRNERCSGVTKYQDHEHHEKNNDRDGPDTDTEDGTCEDDNVPFSVDYMSNRRVFTDRIGSFVVRTHQVKEKTE